MGAEGSHLPLDAELNKTHENGIKSKKNQSPSGCSSSESNSEDDNDNIKHKVNRNSKPVHRPPGIRSSPPRNVSFACRHCLEKFERKPDAIIHMKTCPSRSHRSPKKSQSSLDEQEKSPNGNNNSHDSAKSKNEFSFATTSGTSGKDLVISKRKGEKSFNCKHCGKLFLSVSGCKYHEASHADRRKKYSCKLCFKKFVLPVTRRKHEERCARKSSEERAANAKSACRICGKHFRLNITLKIHEDGHKGIKTKFKCHLCDFRSKYRGSMNRHRKICQPGADGKRIKAETDCGGRMNRPSTSKVGSSRKTGNVLISKCLKCPLTFVDSQLFVDHVKGHCSKKPFLCLVCGKWFRFSQDIKTHTEQLHPFLILFNFCNGQCSSSK